MIQTSGKRTFCGDASDAHRPALTYLHVVGQRVDELKSRDPFVTAHHPDILRMLAVRYSNPIGRAQCQRALLAGAVDVVEPDTP